MLICPPRLEKEKQRTLLMTLVLEKEKQQREKEHQKTALMEQIMEKEKRKTAIEQRKLCEVQLRLEESPLAKRPKLAYPSVGNDSVSNVAKGSLGDNVGLDGSMNTSSLSSYTMRTTLSKVRWRGAMTPSLSLMMDSHIVYDVRVHVLPVKPSDTLAVYRP